MDMFSKCKGISFEMNNRKLHVTFEFYIQIGFPETLTKSRHRLNSITI